MLSPIPTLKIYPERGISLLGWYGRDLVIDVYGRRLGKMNDYLVIRRIFPYRGLSQYQELQAAVKECFLDYAITQKAQYGYY